MSDDGFVMVDRNIISPEIEKISTWLEPTAYRDDSSDFNKHLSAHVPGTGDWIEKTIEYQNWHDDGSDNDSYGILWVKAIAGAGKSVLTASRIIRLESEPQTTVLFFFVRQIVRANLESHALVRDWLDQLLPLSPSLQNALKDCQQNFRSITEMGFAELWRILINALLAMPNRVYCVVDALDELEDKDIEDLAERLVALGTEQPNRIKILISSRPFPQIQQVLGGVRAVLPVRLENRLVNRDIACFIEHRLDQARHLQEEIRDEIKRSIEDRVFPSFLYARLMLNELLDKTIHASVDGNSVRRALQSIPASLEDLYSHMLDVNSVRSGVPKEHQTLILQLVICAARPLRLLEIATVLDFLGMTDSEKTQGNVKHLTRISCGPLLEILPDETVSIIHHSFTEFLTGAKGAGRVKLDEEAFPVIESVEANHKMALICVRYLLSGGLTTWKRQKSSPFFHEAWEDMQQARLEYPFIEYAACNWYIHVSRLPEIEGELLQLLNTFTSPDTPSFLAFVELVMKSHASESTSPLHVCAWGNMTSFAKVLINNGHDCNVTDRQNMTPLARAAISGFPDMVALLLEHGAIPNPEPDSDGSRPLHYAARRNDEKIVRLLVEAGADLKVPRLPDRFRGVSVPPKKRPSPFEYACQAGAVKSVQAMLLYLDDDDLKLAIQWSINAGQLEMVEWLIDLPIIDIDLELLVLAARCKNPQILQIVLDRFTILNKDMPEEHNLILAFCLSVASKLVYQRSSSRDLELCLDILLRTGCDLNARTKNGLTALHLCVKAHAPTLVEQLLKNGADVHATDENGNTPLHFLNPINKFNDRPAVPILHALMRAGARLDVVNHNTNKGGGLTPLLAWCSTARIYKLEIDLLQQYVINWNVTDSQGNTPIHLLLKEGVGEDTLQKLVNNGADPNWRNNEGCAPLHRTQNINQMHMLVSIGADLEIRDYQGRTLLLRTVLENNCSRKLHDVLEMGVDLDATDHEGNGVCHLLCEKFQCLDVLRMVLEAGANPHQRNHRGNTMWHLFMRRALSWKRGTETQSMIYFLLRWANASLAARNNEGQTLLHCMCEGSIDSPERQMTSGEDPIDHLPAREIDSMVDVEDHQGRRPIHLAAARSEALVAWLIRRGATLTGRERCQGRNVLHIAAAARASNTLGLLLENYPDGSQRQKAVNEADNDGWTPMHIACSSGRVESVILLLQAGADITLVEHKKQTPLHACVEVQKKPQLPQNDRIHSSRLEGHGLSPDHKSLRVTEIDRLSVAHGADPIAKNYLGMAPIKLAVDKQNDEMVVTLAETLPATEGDEIRLYLMARDDHIETQFEVVMQNSPKNVVRMCEQLLKRGEYRVLEQLGARGVKRNPRDLPCYPHNQKFLQSVVGDQPHRSVLHILSVGKNWWQTEGVRYLLQRGVDATTRDGEGRTPLHIAVMSGGYRQLGIARLLLDHGADPNALDRRGMTPLGFAVGNTEMVQLLLRHGGDAGLGSEPLLYKAITIQDIDTVRAILERGFDLQKPFRGSLAELDGFERRKPSKSLLYRKSEKEEQRQKELRLLLCRPVHYAAHARFNDVSERHKAVAIVDLLLAHGADPFLSTEDDTTAIHDVLNQGGIVEPLLTLPNLDLERRDGRGRTLLMAACQRGQPNEFSRGWNFENFEYRPSQSIQKKLAVETICEMGADLMVVDETGNNAAHFLAAPGKDTRASVSSTVLFMLIKKCPALVHQENQQNETPLHAAAKGHHWDNVRTLVDAGADPLLSDSQGNTILHHLASCLNTKHPCPGMAAHLPPPEDFWPFFRQILDRGLDINAQNNRGETPLFKYVQSLRCWTSLRGTAIDKFIGAGADLLTQNAERESLLHVVVKTRCGDRYFCKCKENPVDSFIYLMELGLNPLHEDIKQRTPMDIAAVYGKEDILALFKK